MRSLQEKEYLSLCRQKIEESANMGDSASWVQQDFEHLSELIYEKVKVQLSISTLKRLWIYKPDTIPNISTLDALSQFLNYRNWYDFKSRFITGNVRDIELRPGRRTLFFKKANRKYIYTAIALTLVLFLPILLRNLVNDLHQDKVVFKLKETKLSGIPNTVEFQYDISNTGVDFGYIQQDWDPARRVKVPASEKSLYNTYYYPGYFEASLVVDNKVIRKTPVLIETEGWIPVVLVERFQVKPTYIDKNLIVAQNLHISPNDIKVAGIDTSKDYFTNYFNVRNYGDISCDNITLISEIRNNVREGGSSNQYSEIILKFQNGRLLTPFGKSGFTSTLDVEYGEKYLDGSENDFSALGTDLSDWKEIKIEVRNRHVFVFINGLKVYDLIFEAWMGKLVGLQYCFNGCGSVRKTELYDQNGSLVFADYFGN